MLALMFVVSGAARAEPVFSFDATPGKLPKTVVPISYSIELRPDAESLALPGVEVIDIEVREPTARLTLNAVNTTFASVTVDGGAERADVALDAAAETATFTFAQPLAAGAHRLRIEFTARINKFDRGFFFVDYPTDSGVKRLLTSKLEPADARRIFPCWDEPAFKASFALDGDGAAPFPRGRQHAGRARGAARAEPEAGRLRADAENVDLPVRADGGRTGAHHGGGRTA